MKNLTNKEKEMLHTWGELFGKDTEQYQVQVDAYFQAKKEVNEFLKGKEGEKKEGLFKD